MNNKKELNTLIIVKGYYDEAEDEEYSYYLDFINYSDLEVGDNFLYCADMKRIIRKELGYDVIVSNHKTEEEAINCL